MNIDVEGLKEILGTDRYHINTVYTINIHDNLLEALIVEIMRDCESFSTKYYYSFCLNGKLFQGGFTIDDMNTRDKHKIVSDFIAAEVSKYISQALIMNLSKKVSPEYIRGVKPSEVIKPKPKEEPVYTDSDFVIIEELRLN